MILLSDTGKLMARYCVAFETMKNFHKITGSETTEELVRIPTIIGNSHILHKPAGVTGQN